MLEVTQPPAGHPWACRGWGWGVVEGRWGLGLEIGVRWRGGGGGRVSAHTWASRGLGVTRPQGWLAGRRGRLEAGGHGAGSAGVEGDGLPPRTPVRRSLWRRSVVGRWVWSELCPSLCTLGVPVGPLTVRGSVVSKMGAVTLGSRQTRAARPEVPAVAVGWEALFHRRGTGGWLDLGAAKRDLRASPCLGSRLTSPSPGESSWVPSGPCFLLRELWRQTAPPNSAGRLSGDPFWAGASGGALSSDLSRGGLFWSSALPNPAGGREESGSCFLLPPPKTRKTLPWGS